MKIGYQTLTWGLRLDNLGRVLDEIAAAGYQGVEIAQRPEMIGDRGYPISIQELLKLLHDRNLVLIGLSGGTIEERMQFCGSFRPEYLYTESWHETAASRAVSEGFTLALHAHYLKSIHRLEDAALLLEEHPELKWLPDTGHATVVGDDPLEAIHFAKDRLAAVHLKDWTPVFGRSAYRYARGFVELGRGVVALEAVINELRAIRYSGWLVVEQDTTRTDANTSLVQSARWLVDNGLISKTAHRPTTSTIADTVSTSDRRRPPTHLDSVRSMLFEHRLSTLTCYDRIVRAVAQVIPSYLVSLWMYCSLNDSLTLLSTTPSDIAAPAYIRSASSVLTGIALERHAVTALDLTSPEPGRHYNRPSATVAFGERIAAVGLKWMLSVPLLNPDNINHVPLVLNIFPKTHPCPFSEEDLLWLGLDIARLVATEIDDTCLHAATSANILAGHSELPSDYEEGLGKLIQSLLFAEAVSLFLVNETGDRLEPVFSTGLLWSTTSKDEQFYAKGEGLTGRVWERGEPIVTVDARLEQARKGKSSEIVVSQEDSCLIAPLTDPIGNVVGVVRCQNKVPSKMGQTTIYSDADIAVIDAINQAAMPNLHLRINEERRVRAVIKLRHELQVPVVAMRGAVECMQYESAMQQSAPFSFDYLSDIWSWSDLMIRLLKNTMILGQRPRLEVSEISLFQDVIAPAVRHVAILLRERHFAPDRITRGRFSKIPALWIDRHMFEQVVFNLLSNAIKYAYTDPNAFHVEIDGTRSDDTFVIRFRDWGTGIRKGTEDRIFLEGVRGPDASDKHVAGQGLGLWVVRQVVEAHGGHVTVTSPYMPTEISIRLPTMLAIGHANVAIRTFRAEPSK